MRQPLRSRTIRVAWRVGIVALMLWSCPRQRATAPQAEAVDAAPPLPQPYTFSAETPHLLFSVLGPDGRAVNTEAIADIPEELRDRVMVVDLSQTPEARQADRFVFFADLSRPDPGGAFTAHPMSRFKVPPPRSGAAAAAPEESDAAVVIYTAPWCGYCKQAKAYLRQKGIAFVERDVEGSAAAARELQAKLQRAGASANGVPVLDIGGTLVMGFDRGRVDELLGRLAAGATQRD